MIISVLNIKGGVGKSTTSTNVAVGLSQVYDKVLLIDTDNNGSSSATHWGGLRSQDLPSPVVIQQLNPELLKKQIKTLAADYDVIIIDGSPHVETMTTVSVMLSDLVIIPVQPSPFDFWATKEKIIPIIENAKEYRTDLTAMYLLNCVDPRTSMSKDIEEALQGDVKSFQTKIHVRNTYREVACLGLTAFESKNKKAKQEVTELVDEILELIKGM